MAKAGYKIKTYNQISEIGLARFKAGYEVSAKLENPDAIILRSFNLHDEPINDTLLAVGRAGAGVNNIPIDKLSQKGVVVFNAPGANANSVKELVIAGMLIAGRNLAEALQYTSALPDDNLAETVEAGKKKFAGNELYGKTLGVIGLGSIGYRVANASVDLGMKVLGYDPAMTVQNAWQLSSDVTQIENLDRLLEQSDYITIHVPLLDATNGLINQEKIALLKAGAVLLNFSRDEIVDEQSVVAALKAGNLRKYVTDFPNQVTKGQANVIALPHLGASTAEAEDNCAVMVVDQLQDYLENGNVRHSVNFPNAVLPHYEDVVRLAIIHNNLPGVVAQISNILGTEKINIARLLNKSRDSIAYTIMDLEVTEFTKELSDKLKAVPEILKLRALS